jgi:hypothetical protein
MRVANGCRRGVFPVAAILREQEPEQDEFIREIVATPGDGEGGLAAGHRVYLGGIPATERFPHAPLAPEEITGENRAKP